MNFAQVINYATRELIARLIQRDTIIKRGDFALEISAQQRLTILRLCWQVLRPEIHASRLALPDPLNDLCVVGYQSMQRLQRMYWRCFVN